MMIAMMIAMSMHWALAASVVGVSWITIYLRKRFSLKIFEVLAYVLQLGYMGGSMYRILDLQRERISSVEESQSWDPLAELAFRFELSQIVMTMFFVLGSLVVGVRCYAK